MLSNLSIKNYALIDALEVSFHTGFTVITGETGAGKSILLGGLALVLGKRADLGSLRDKERKCIVEAAFKITKYRLRPFFEQNDLDYEDETILRREIHPSGKSRAFINDSPVTLSILSALGERLIDVHSQHQTLRLTENEFQLKVIDALADNKQNLQAYGTELKAFRDTEKRLQQLIATQKEANKEKDYDSFLLQELETAALSEGMQEALESEQQKLSNVETILEYFANGYQLLSDDQLGIMSAVTQLTQLSGKLADFGEKYENLHQRIQSVHIEMEDIASEWESLKDTTEADPERLEQLNGQLQLLYDLLRKHDVQNVNDLLSVQEALSQKVGDTANLEVEIAEKEALLAAQKETLEAKASIISQKRTRAIPILDKELSEVLSSLGMPSATFKMELTPAANFKETGKDDLAFLFSANKGVGYGELKKVASGGELSRIMLTIKAVLARYEQLPTMMFDEIDTGVSGEISNKMGDIMKAMSNHMQVFSITHLPQVASKGDAHFKVFKEEIGETTHTKLKQLQQEERVSELAEMLGGKVLTDSAMAHARQLLD
ncbi:DNA repair protein RecN [Maribacter sp. 2-571]|uniref:DNA repair protein RecN n=1 Tax=Maribacter sp. 2-571 TaxID=3417569 RepID=UPI003D34978B